jgi:hypothetical protein
VRREKSEQEYFRAVRQVRDAMLNIPPRVSGILAAERDQARVFEIITKEIHQALEELAHDLDHDEKKIPS